MIYLSQIGRGTQLRLEEHLKSYEKNDRSSTVAEYLLDSSHSRNLINIKLIHVATIGRLTNKLQEWEVVAESQREFVTSLNRISFNSFIPFIYKLQFLSFFFLPPSLLSLSLTFCGVSLITHIRSLAILFLLIDEPLVSPRPVNVYLL